MAFHSTPAHRSRDDARLNAFTHAGLRTLVFRWHQVLYEFDQVAGTIRQSLTG